MTSVKITPYQSCLELPFDTTTAADPPNRPKPDHVPLLRPCYVQPSEAAHVPNQVFDNGRRLLAHSDNVDITRIRNKIRTIPAFIPEFILWYRRLRPVMEKRWKILGIDRAIRASLYQFHIRPNFLTTVLCFWDSNLNCLVLPQGMVGPSLLDAELVAQLPLSGADPYNLPDPPQYDFVTTDNGWGGFVRNNRGEKGSPITDKEHAAFLMCWINR